MRVPSAKSKTNYFRMKAIFIVFNQVLSERVKEMLGRAGVRGFSQWVDVQGRGSVSGEPHMGDDVWPALNSAMIAVVNSERVDEILAGVRKINENAQMQGIRAFVWNIEGTV